MYTFQNNRKFLLFFFFSPTIKNFINNLLLLTYFEQVWELNSVMYFISKYELESMGVQKFISTVKPLERVWEPVETRTYVHQSLWTIYCFWNRNQNRYLCNYRTFLIPENRTVNKKYSRFRLFGLETRFYTHRFPWWLRPRRNRQRQRRYIRSDIRRTRPVLPWPTGARTTSKRWQKPILSLTWSGRICNVFNIY